MFECLMSEVECINRAYGYRGIFDAIVYIQTNSAEYEGTAVYSEFRKFMAMGQQLFATKEVAFIPLPQGALQQRK